MQNVVTILPYLICLTCLCFASAECIKLLLWNNIRKRKIMRRGTWQWHNRRFNTRYSTTMSWHSKIYLHDRLGCKMEYLLSFCYALHSSWWRLEIACIPLRQKGQRRKNILQVRSLNPKNPVRASKPWHQEFESELPAAIIINSIVQLSVQTTVSRLVLWMHICMSNHP